MKKLLCASVVLSFLFCGCQSTPVSSPAPSASSVEAPAVSEVISASNLVSDFEPVSVAESSADPEPQEPLVTVTIPAVVDGVDFSDMDIDSAKETWGFADAVKNEDGSITFTMPESIQDEYLAFTRKSFLTGWFSSTSQEPEFDFIFNVTYDDPTRSAEVVLKDGADYDENSVSLMFILAMFQREVTVASEICGDFSITVTVVGYDGTVYDTYVADSTKSETVAEVEPTAEFQPETSSIPYEYQNALTKADKYLRYSSFSYSGLIDQLEYEGCTAEAATYAADNCGADWYEQAVETAADYLRYSAFSYSGLIDQLEYEGFSTQEATYAADNCGADWNEQAAKKASDYLSFSSFNRSRLIEQLEFEGFTHDQAVYGADQNGL